MKKKLGDFNTVLGEENALELVCDFIDTKEWWIVVDPHLPNFDVLDRMDAIEHKYYWGHGEDFKILFDMTRWSIFIFKKSRITHEQINEIVNPGKPHQHRREEQDILLPIPNDATELAPAHVEFMLTIDRMVTLRKNK